MLASVVASAMAEVRDVRHEEVVEARSAVWEVMNDCMPLSTEVASAMASFRSMRA